MYELKSCPFCGVVPTIEWEPWEEISKTAGIFNLEANHKPECFLYNMNGLNIKGRMSRQNITLLVDAWNRRADNG